jgi:hypothetical protein
MHHYYHAAIAGDMVSVSYIIYYNTLPACILFAIMGGRETKVSFGVALSRTPNEHHHNNNSVLLSGKLNYLSLI